MRNRVLIAIPIVLIVALAVFVQGWALSIFAVILALACQFEIVRAMDHNGKPVLKAVSYLFAVLIAVLFLKDFSVLTDANASSYILFNGTVMLIILVIFSMTSFIAAMFSKRQTADSIINTVFTFIYPQFFYLMLYLVILLFANDYLKMLFILLILFIIPMLSDTMAFFIGKKFGRKKLCPSISPKKTVAGSIGGAIGGLIAASIIWLFASQSGNWFGWAISVNSLPIYMLCGVVLSLISQLGDLAASFIKRLLNVKDFGKILQGHGGIVDRTDSIMFCMPIVFLMAYLQILL